MTDQRGFRFHARSMAIATTVAATIAFIAGERVGNRVAEGHEGSGALAAAMARAPFTGEEGNVANRTLPAVEEAGGIGADCNTQIR
jgi:hypothetical protein